jgi:hypothetical protein
MKTSISKSGFMLGVQCQRALHMHYNSPELRAPLNMEQQRIIDQGIQVGKVARQLFPGGKDVSLDGLRRSKALYEATRQELVNSSVILYEAGFESPTGGLNCRVDILVKQKQLTKLIEVKSSTSIKSEHILDAAIQYNVLKRSGYPGEIEVFIAHLNNTYVRGLDIEVKKLFTIVNVTNEVLNAQRVVDAYVIEFEKTLNGNRPNITIGEHCFKPYDCPFREHCWKDVPKYSVFNLGGIRKSKATQLFNMGYSRPEELPRNINLNDKQWIEIDSAIRNTVHINRPALRAFLSQFSTTLLYMDFESYNPAIPLYDGTRPYQHLCFQYSVILQRPCKTLVKREFVSEPGLDPRHEFIKKLIHDTKENVPILVYNRVFEITRLKEFIADPAFAQYKEQIEERITRIIDVMQPFQARHVYSPFQEGSFSIKKVLPAFSASKLSYRSMAIQNGAEAMVKYESLKGLAPLDREKIIQDLKDYCYLDVYGLTIILESLKQLAYERKSAAPQL